jgi:thiol-disulfide isomerase/thioredoxin
MPEARYAISRFNPDRAVQIGKPVPEFEVKLISGETVSRQSLLGKFYMIDFWAVWCGPCVGEMPKLHEAYEEFKGKNGFEVLSLSFDRSPDDIAKFRAEKFKMPWLHTFLDGGFKNELSKRFEVESIPKRFWLMTKALLWQRKANCAAKTFKLRSLNF